MSENLKEKKEIRLIVRIKNNRLVSIRESMGMSQERFSKHLKMTPSHYGLLENLKIFPVKKLTNEWSSTAKKISKKLNLPPEYIWPNALKYIEKNKIEQEISATKLFLLNQGEQKGPSELLLKDEFNNKINESLKTLDRRAEKILRMRFGFDDGQPKTLEEIGECIGVQKERIRQIEQRALRQLRHPFRSKKLKEFVDDNNN